MWDKETTFSDQQALAAGNSENVVDAGPDDIGLGHPVYLQLALTKGATGALEVAVETSDNVSLSDAITLVTYKVEADRVARGGIILAAQLPTGCKRYLRLAYSGAAGGKITAGLTPGVQTSTLK